MKDLREKTHLIRIWCRCRASGLNEPYCLNGGIALALVSKPCRHEGYASTVTVCTTGIDAMMVISDQRKRLLAFLPVGRTTIKCGQADDLNSRLERVWSLKLSGEINNDRHTFRQ